MEIPVICRFSFVACIASVLTRRYDVTAYMIS